MSIRGIAHRIANIPFVKRTLTENRFFVRLFFNLKYRKPDPYLVEESAYERDKYAKIESALKKLGRDFPSALDVGCAEGRLTGLMAPFCGRVVGIDISDVAIARAKKHLAEVKNAEARRFDLFTGSLDEKFDLVVVADTLYYFEPHQLPSAARKVAGAVAPGGALLLAHVRAAADDDAGIPFKKFGARTIHDMFASMDEFETAFDELTPEFRVTVLNKAK